MERKLSPRSANKPTDEAAACRLLAPPRPARLDIDDEDDVEDDEDDPHDEQWSVPTYLRREVGSMPRPSSWTVIIDDDDDELLLLVLPLPPVPALPPPTTTVTAVASLAAAFRTNSSTARPVLPMTVPARTEAEAADERGRTRPPELVLFGLLTVLILMVQWRVEVKSERGQI